MVASGSNVPSLTAAMTWIKTRSGPANGGPRVGVHRAVVRHGVISKNPPGISVDAVFSAPGQQCSLQAVRADVREVIHGVAIPQEDRAEGLCKLGGGIWDFQPVSARIQGRRQRGR